MPAALATKSSKNRSGEQAEKRPAEVGRQAVPTSSHGAVLALQRSAGNHAVNHLLGRGLSTSTGVVLQRECAGNRTMASGECGECSEKKRSGLQTKLEVNEPGDIYEQEADRIADQVMAAPAQTGVSAAPPRIQRLSGQRTGHANAAPASVDQALASPGRPLEPTLRQDMEQRFGYDFSRVRVHSAAAAEQSAVDVNARAYTVGHDIVFGAGVFTPGTHQGRRLIAHELTHVVQQSVVDGMRVGRSDEKRGPSSNYSMQVPGAAPLYVQRKPGGGASPTPSMQPWLSGVTATHVQGNIYKIYLTVEGQTYVGPYQELKKYVATNNLGLESHHIVGDEFIGMVATGYTNETMPAVALRPKGHEPITTSVSAQLRWYGGRRGGRVQLEAAEIADIYKEAYTQGTYAAEEGEIVHGATPFNELYIITENILKLPHEVKPASPLAPAKPATTAPTKTATTKTVTSHKHSNPEVSTRSSNLGVPEASAAPAGPATRQLPKLGLLRGLRQGQQ